MDKKFLKKYQNKILNLNSLIKIINKKKKDNKKIIMCHGVFDVVHPGHVRHLVYAKSKADILLVSITADQHIKKGVYRPHVPQNIRALNLAAFEMVDYVLIDTNEKPLKNLIKIKPDFYAKGFEYTSSGLPKATQDEQKVINKYGGKLIFTPGDIVYSSSKILNTKLPNLQSEKLVNLMRENNIDFNFLKNILKKFKNYKIQVLGDTIIDTYTKTDFIGGQTKSPTFSVLYRDHKNYVGGAGIVAKHLRAAGAKVKFITVLGNDKLKDFAIKNLKKDGIKTRAYIDPTRPTTNKNTIISKNYRLLKVDRLDNLPVSQNILNQICKDLKNSKNQFNAVIFSDFRHGIFNSLSIKPLCNSIPKLQFKIADSQVASRWGNIIDFKNFNLITPNEREGRFATADQDSTVGLLASKIQQKAKCKNLILKLGERGIFCSTNKNVKNKYFSIDTFVDSKRLIDPVGSGDALLAYSSLTLLETNSLVAAGIIGSVAAACECELDGNIPIESKFVIEKLNAIEKQISYQTE